MYAICKMVSDWLTRAGICCLISQRCGGVTDSVFDWRLKGRRFNPRALVARVYCKSIIQLKIKEILYFLTLQSLASTLGEYTSRVVMCDPSQLAVKSL